MINGIKITDKEIKKFSEIMEEVASHKKSDYVEPRIIGFSKDQLMSIDQMISRLRSYTIQGICYSCGCMKPIIYLPLDEHDPQLRSFCHKCLTLLFLKLFGADSVSWLLEFLEMIVKSDNKRRNLGTKEELKKKRR